jgi:VWFA-related protein
MRFVLLVALFSIIASGPVIYAQQRKAADPADDVVRISTELVQTDLTVVDKRGRFVEGLRPDQFLLSLDGKPQSISFFELIKTGSARESAQLAAARGDRLGDQPAAVPAAGNQGRIILFFLDDLHLSGASLIRARQALTEFIDNQMRQNDQVAIVSTSGQIGFLQQLSDYKPMLHAAIDRLAYRKNPETYGS